MKVLLPFLALLILAGCGTKSGAAGSYQVVVPTSDGKMGAYGKLILEESGQFRMHIGKLDMSGTWAQEGDMVHFTSADAGAKMLSAQKYKIDGKKLRPVGELGLQTHWWLQKE